MKCKTHLLLLTILLILTYGYDVDVDVSGNTKEVEYSAAESYSSVFEAAFTSEAFMKGDYVYSLSEEEEIKYNAMNKERSDLLKEDMHWVWRNYVDRCFGSDEIRPLSGTCNEFWGKMGMMVVESLDTLWVMDLHEDFQEGEEWVQSQLHFDMDHYTSVFETIIRMLGGLLSSYAVSGDGVFKEKAVDLADRLLKSYNSDSGLSVPNINLATGHVRETERSVYLSETATNYLEFSYLSQITGDPKYRKVAERVITELKTLNREDLFYTVYEVYGHHGRGEKSIGNRADSYYEYLLKGWLFDKKENEDFKVLFNKAIDYMHQNLLKTSTHNRFVYIADAPHQSTMHHLTCFLPGALALAVKEGLSTNPDRDLHTAYQVMYTCYSMYNTTASGVAAERYSFGDEEHEIQVHGMSKYLLRPETIESLYVMYNVTHNPIIREWGWNIWKSIRKACKGQYGFADVSNVNSPQSPKDDRGETFFYSETMKYLYLLFNSEKSDLLDKYILNTEAHLIPFTAGVNYDYLLQS